MEPARLLREVDDHSSFFSLDVVATLDERNNLIRVRRSWWVRQHPHIQRLVWRMKQSYFVDTDFLHIQLPTAA